MAKDSKSDKDPKPPVVDDPKPPSDPEPPLEKNPKPAVLTFKPLELLTNRQLEQYLDEFFKRGGQGHGYNVAATAAVFFDKSGICSAGADCRAAGKTDIEVHSTRASQLRVRDDRHDLSRSSELVIRKLATLFSFSCRSLGENSDFDWSLSPRRKVRRMAPYVVMTLQALILCNDYASIVDVKPARIYRS